MRLHFSRFVNFRGLVVRVPLQAHGSRTLSSLLCVMCMLGGSLVHAADSDNSDTTLDELFADDAAVDMTEPTQGEAFDSTSSEKAGQDNAEPSEREAGSSDSVPVISLPEAAIEKAAARPRNRLIEEIIVTAEKREVSIQDVPIAVSAFSGEKLAAMGISSVDELPKVTPGLTFSTQFGYTQIFLRGIGSNAFLPSADPYIPIYLDGVALLTAHATVTKLGRLDRVEVLKGPQGTLFGRNSTAGAVQLISPDPSGEFNGDIQFEYGDYDTLNTLLFIDAPLTDSFGLTLSGFSQGHETFVQNIGAETFDTYERGGRIKMVWDVTDDFSVGAWAALGEQSGNNGVSMELTRTAPVLTGGGFAVPVDPALDREVNTNVPGGTTNNIAFYSLSADWRLPWAELKFIGSDQSIDLPRVSFDFDGSTRPLVSFGSTDQFFEQSTLELQLLSTANSPLSDYFSWVGGLYYLEGFGGFEEIYLSVAEGGLFSLAPGIGGFVDVLNDLSRAAGLPSGIPGATGPVTALNGGMLRSESLSAYFQSTVPLGQIFDLKRDLNLILGVRWDTEKRGIEGSFLGAENPANGERITLLNFSAPDISGTFYPFRVALQWFAGDATQIYGSWSRANTAPTYNTINFFSAPESVRAAEVTNYEVGIKTSLLDNTMTLNAAAFYADQVDALTAFVSITSGGIVRFNNVPKSRSAGIEFDMNWQPMPEWNPGMAIVASATYLDAKYTDYPEGRGYDAATGLPFGPGGPPTPPLPARDLSGNDVDRTPPFSYTFGINQMLSIGRWGELELAVDTNYSDGYFYDAQNEPLYATDAFQIFDARVTYFYRPWKLELTAFGRNITDELYVNSAVPIDFGLLQQANPPRVFGLRMKLGF